MPRTKPDHKETGWPTGIPFIVGNEAAERFSYYGMATILYFYLEYLFQRNGASAQDAADGATTLKHMFFAGVYATPILGAILADKLLGKYRTILYLSLFYCFGHGLMAIGEESTSLTAFGLVLIALGAGGIKPCVGAHVGDQFGEGNWHRLARIYQIFYFAINLGAAASTLLIPFLRDRYGYSVAFGVPGILMGLATLMFWLGRNRFVHIPAKPGGKLGLMDVGAAWLMFLAPVTLLFFQTMSWYQNLGALWQIVISLALFCSGLALFFYRQSIKADDGFLSVIIYSIRAKLIGEKNATPAIATDDSTTRKRSFFAAAERRFGVEKVVGPKAVVAIAFLFSFISVFWALFDQTHTTWTAQAEHLHRTYEVLGWDVTIAPDQFQAANPILILLLVPFMATIGLPALRRLTKRPVRPLTQMRIGMYLTVTSFIAVALIQHGVDAGHSISVWWQLIAYLLLTTAEVMVSITGLEFAYSQAPSSMKSVIVGIWYLSVSLGNLLVAGITSLDATIAGWFVEAAPGEQPALSQAQRFWLYAGLMFLAATAFLIASRFYRYRDYTPDGLEVSANN